MFFAGIVGMLRTVAVHGVKQEAERTRHGRTMRLVCALLSGVCAMVKAFHGLAVACQMGKNVDILSRKIWYNVFLSLRV